MTTQATNTTDIQKLKIAFTPKQLEYVNKATHLMNFKIGATRSGKTHLDIQWTIPNGIMERRGLKGLNFILGVSKGTIERNLLAPMREIWGTKLVGEINSENKAILFGEVVYCLGTEKSSQVSKLRGAEAKYIYWDEICEANEEVFELVKSRLSLPYSRMDATANPKSPSHFIKQFIDKPDLDIYVQSYTIFDNLFLTKKFVDELCKQYKGTIFYDRYILGMWKRAEGAIYREFTDNTSEFILHEKPDPRNIMAIKVGIDFGGNKSAHAFIAVAYLKGLKKVIVIDEKVIRERLTPQDLSFAYVKFAKNIYNEYRQPFETYYDNAEPVLARGIAEACQKYAVQTIVRPALKSSIIDRIRLTNALMANRTLQLLPKCETLIRSFQEAVWNEKKLDDERLDDNSYCVDVLDAFEYCIERDTKTLLVLNN